MLRACMGQCLGFLLYYYHSLYIYFMSKLLHGQVGGWCFIHQEEVNRGKSKPAERTLYSNESLKMWFMH